jgi:hypothetical protein
MGILSTVVFVTTKQLPHATVKRMSEVVGLPPTHKIVDDMHPALILLICVVEVPDE